MAAKRSKTYHSLTFTFLRWLILFSVTVLILLAVIYSIMTTWMERILRKPVIGDFLNYMDQLCAEEYSQIPIQSLKDCAFVILDETHSPIYSSSPDVKSHFTDVELKCIRDYKSRLFYTVSKMKGNRSSYLITQRYYENGVEVIGKYCVLDKEYRIISGTLFPGVTDLTETEFHFIEGEFNRDSHTRFNVAKYEFTTDEGEIRTAVFYSPQYSIKNQAHKLNNWNRIWYFIIPLFPLTVALFGFLISREMKRYLRPLNAALLGIPSGQPVDLQQYRGPREFVEIARTFDRVTEELEESQREKQALDEQKRRMLMDISHDLKTPITVIQGYARAICDGIVPQKEIVRYAELISQKAAAVSGLTEAFLEYSTISRPDFGVDARCCDICETLKEYFGERYEELEDKGFSLTAELPETAVFCRLDSSAFRRILDNIVNNSLRYNPGGTEIFCGLTEKDDHVELILGDKGTGIPPEIQDTIFDPFVTGDCSRGPGGGHGLGMSIVKLLVEDHDGSVTLLKEPPEGLHTAFCLRFSLVEPETEPKS